MEFALPRRIAARAVFATLLLAFAAMSARDARAADAAVSIANFAFAPGSVSITVGDTVTWTNTQAGVPHTATSDTAGVFNSGTLNNGGVFAHTFTAAGTFTYHCNIHPEMTGSVVVAAGAAATATAPAPTATTAAPTATTAAPTATATTAATAATATATTAGTPPTAATSAAGSPTPGAPAAGDNDGTGGSNATMVVLVIGGLVIAAGAGAYALMRRRAV